MAKLTISFDTSNPDEDKNARMAMTGKDAYLALYIIEEMICEVFRNDELPIKWLTFQDYEGVAIDYPGIMSCEDISQIDGVAMATILMKAIKNILEEYKIDLGLIQ